MTYKTATRIIEILIVLLVVISVGFVFVAATAGASLAAGVLFSTLCSLIWLAAGVVWFFWG